MELISMHKVECCDRYREVVMRFYLALCLATMTAFSVSPAVAQQNSKEAILVGPWSITTTYKGDKFENCMMSITGDDVTRVLHSRKTGFCSNSIRPNGILNGARLIL